MIKALEYSYKKIKQIQKSNNQPKFPMIILKTPKGWTGIKYLHNEKLEGNCLSHQVIAKEAKENKEDRIALEQWLKSYNFNELFNKSFIKEIESVIPKENLRMGLNKHAYASKMYKPLKLPNPEYFEEDAKLPGTIGSSSMRRAGAYLNQVFKLNKNNFRLMSPDETYSNKLDEVFKTTSRAFIYPIKPWDKDISPDGRVMEMLSEHTLQGLAQGYVLTGRHIVFASYEAFIEVISSMADQYEKFLKVSQEIPWRENVASFNYILTSSGWRQEHNGFSHQNPKFITGMLEKNSCLTKVYFPPDGNSTLVVLDKCLKEKNCINIIVAGKTLEARWLTADLARKELSRGLMVWDFASDKNPDIVFAAIGDYLTKESLAAIDALKKYLPEIKIRFINIIELTSIGIGNSECHLPFSDFEDYFTKDKPVILNYHGYPNDIKPMLLDKSNPERFRVHGYIENGSTTTPLDMHIRNKTSRFDIAIESIQLLSYRNVISKSKSQEIIKIFEKKLQDHSEYIKKYGVDPDEIEHWKWTRNI